MDNSNGEIDNSIIHQHGEWIQYKKPGKCNIRILALFHSIFTATAMTFLAGYVIGFASPTLVELTQLQDEELNFDTTLADIFGASSLVGAIFGAPIGGYIADKFGRKTSLLCNTIPYIVGFFMVITTSVIQNGLTFKIILITGRFATGIGQSWSYVVVTIYIGEIVFAKGRGSILALSDIIVYAGSVMMLGLGSIPGIHYYHLAVFPLAVMLMYIIMATWIPETPRWLLLYFKDKPRAIAVMKYLKGPAINAEKKLEEIQKSSLTVAKLPFHQILSKLFCYKENLIPFLIAALVIIHEQSCGFSALVNNIGYILQTSKVPNPDFVGFLAGLVLIPGTVVCGLLVDIVGRKALLISGTLGMSVGQALLGFQFFFIRPRTCNDSVIDAIGNDSATDCSLNLYYLAIASVTLFLFSYSCVGPISLILVSEYLPLQVKGIANGILWSFNRVAGAVIAGTFLNFSKWAGDWTAWWTLSFLNVLVLVAITLFVVETKGKKLEDIPMLFRKRYTNCIAE